MNFIQFESAQKLRGGFYTDSDIADFLVRWSCALRPERVLEPSCGDGAFLAALDHMQAPKLKSIFACELDPAEAAKAKERFGRKELEVHAGDFLRWFLFQGQQAEPFDAVVGNPPFVRYQYLPEEQQFLAEKVFGRFGLPFTKHTNVWVPFVMAALALLRPGGRLGMVLPSELLHITHAQSLRQLLASQCARILILDPETIWFADTLQGTVLLLAEKKGTQSNKAVKVAVRPVGSRDMLRDDAEDWFTGAEYSDSAALGAKWMCLLLDEKERVLLTQLRTGSRVTTFRDLATVDVGIVTGANKFFLVSDEVVDEFQLRQWACPMFGRSEHLHGLIYSESDHLENRKSRLPTNFLWFQEKDESLLPAGARRYLARGVAENLPTRFKCRVREPWYTVPSVYAAPVAMLKRAHHYPRLVLNRAGAYSTDTAYRIRPHGIAPEALVYSFPNSLTCLSAELEGRHYGGGVLELVPSEIERLLIPLVVPELSQLQALDQEFRVAADRLEFLAKHDAVVLGELGLGKADQATLFAAWDKLRTRRQRVTKGSVCAED
jgi:adenine-specific DNA-methyltransferase